MLLNDLATPASLLPGTTTITKSPPTVVDISHSPTLIVAIMAHINLYENAQAKGTKDSVNYVINKDIVSNAVLVFALLSLQLLLPITLLLLLQNHQTGFLILQHLIMSSMILTISPSPRLMKVRMLLL